MPVERRSRGPSQIIAMTLLIGFVVGVAAQLTKQGLMAVLPGSAAAIDVLASAAGTAIVVTSIPLFIVIAQNTKTFELPLLSRYRLNY